MASLKKNQKMPLLLQKRSNLHALTYSENPASSVYLPVTVAFPVIAQLECLRRRNSYSIWNSLGSHSNCNNFFDVTLVTEDGKVNKYWINYILHLPEEEGRFVNHQVQYPLRKSFWIGNDLPTSACQLFLWRVKRCQGVLWCYPGLWGWWADRRPQSDLGSCQPRTIHNVVGFVFHPSWTLGGLSYSNNLSDVTLAVEDSNITK